jgi:fructose transport system ATP-binding protein
VGTQEGAVKESTPEPVPVLQARGLVKRYGRVTALNGSDFDLHAGEVLAVVGDNGAGKSCLIKALSGALTADAGEILLDGQIVRFHSPLEARRAGIETVYQTLALAPAMDISSNLFLGRETRRRGILGSVFRMLDKRAMNRDAQVQLDNLGIATVQQIGQIVETLSGGQRQAVAVARAAMFGTRLVIMDEPTAALGVKESGMVLDLIRRIRDRGLPVVLISHDMPHVFEIADRIHVHRLGQRVAVVSPKEHTMTEVVSLMTGALRLEENGELVDATGHVTELPDEDAHA